jgi:dipeptidyl aminopeptidase/acylaminoacyl peptidase
MRHTLPLLAFLLLPALAATPVPEMPATTQAVNESNTDLVRPAANLHADGIPPIPRQIVNDVARYTDFRGATFQSWHPARREMLIATRFADVVQAHRVRAPGAARYQLTFSADGINSAIYPEDASAADDYFVFSQDVGGSEFNQLYRFDLKAGAGYGRITLLTDGKSRNDDPQFAHKSPDVIAYTSTRRNGRENDIYLVDARDPSDPRSRMLAQVEGAGWGVGEFSPDDSMLLAIQYVSINESYLSLLDVATGKMRPLTPPKSADANAEKVFWGGGRFARDERGVYTVTDKGSEFRRLVYLPVDGGEPQVLSGDINWDVNEFDLSEDGKLLAFVTNEGGADVLHVLDTASREQLTTLPKLPAGLIGGVRFHKKNHDLAISMSSAKASSDVYSIDVTSGKLERWTRSESGGVDPGTFVEPELVKWKSFDGREITGFLYRPPAEKFPGKRPVIINIHGGPEGQSRPTFLGRSNYYLNELGVAMLLPNVRGSTGYGKTFTTLDNAERREDSVKDIGALLDWIAKDESGLDASRVMVMGGSYGGFMSYAVATHYNDRIRCAFSAVGIANFTSFLQRTQGYRQDLRRAEYGDERDPKMQEVFRRISPLFSAQNITKPLFVVQGRNDPRVPMYEAEQMVAKVKQNGGPVWYLLADDEGHGFAKKKNVDYLFYATAMFVREYLLK